MEDSIELRIEKLVYGGDGIGRLDGQAVFVAGTAPGDLAIVRPIKRTKGFIRAELEKIVEPGPARREAPCEYFGRCGGCQLQHLEYSAQVDAKASMVAETLSRIGKIELSEPIEVIADTEHELGYRIRATAHVAHSRAGAHFGFYEAGSQRVVDIASCPLLVPELDAAWGAARAAAPTLHRVRELELSAGDSGVGSSPAIAAVPGTEISVTAAGLHYVYPPGSFFQVNRPLLDRLVGAVTHGLAGATAVDLYSGVGLFALPLARSFAKVVAVEGNAMAASAARANAERNGFDNIEIEALAVESWLERAGTESAGLDAVVADPPRAGLGPAAVADVLRLRPRTLVYVACDPSTLARDLRLLVDGGFAIETVTMIDLFPQTFHVETVVRLRSEHDA